MQSNITLKKELAKEKACNRLLEEKLTATGNRHRGRSRPLEDATEEH